jgi:hypothetical protein
MSSSRLAIVTAVVALLSGVQVQAQQPQQADSMGAGMMAMSGNCMRSEAAADQRLGHLVDAMNAAPPNRRAAAMMAVIRELVARDREVRAHMNGMMQGMHMMGMMQTGDSGGGARSLGKDHDQHY